MKVKYIPNILSVFRMILSVLLIFLFDNPQLFIIIYLFTGITDVLDGFIARKYNVQSITGARLDSFADMMFYVVLTIYLFSQYKDIMLSYLLFIAVIIALKFISIIIGFIKYRKLVMVHTIANKLTGISVFLLPFFLWLNMNFFIILILILAIFASIEELIIILINKGGNINLNQKSIFIKE